MSVTKTTTAVDIPLPEGEAPPETGHTHTFGTRATIADGFRDRVHQCAGREMEVTGVEGVAMMNLTEHRRQGGGTTTDSVRCCPSSCARALVMNQRIRFQDAPGPT